MHTHRKSKQSHEFIHSFIHSSSIHASLDPLHSGSAPPAAYHSRSPPPEACQPPDGRATGPGRPGGGAKATALGPRWLK